MDRIVTTDKIFKKTPKITEIIKFYTLQTKRYCQALYIFYWSTMSFTLLPIIFPDPKKSNLPLAFYLPFIPHDITPYWQINYFYQSFIIVACIHILAGLDGIIFAGIVNICCQFDILMEYLKMINDEAQTEDSDEAIEKMLCEINDLHSKTKDFLHKIGHLFTPQIFVIFPTAAAILCTSLNVIAMDNRTPIYNFLFAAGFQIFIVCLLGNKIVIKSDEFTNAIYDIDWYKFSVKNQKIFKMILQNSQLDIQLQIVLFPLNVNSFLQVS